MSCSSQQDCFGRLRDLRHFLLKEATKPESETITLNDIEIGVYRAVSVINAFCPRRSLNYFMEKLKVFKEASFLILTPDKELVTAKFKVIKKQEVDKV